MQTNRAMRRRSRLQVRELLWLFGRLFPPGRVIDSVTTTARFDAPPEAVWRSLVFYEQVPQRPPLLLLVLLPSPVRTHGNGKHVGAVVECSYSSGSLLKRITTVERPHLLRFEVIEQYLGVERCVTTVEGSYEIRQNGRGSELALTTRYRGHLRPRGFWRPFERYLAHQLHRHILGGVHVIGGQPVRAEGQVAP